MLFEVIFFQDLELQKSSQPAKRNPDFDLHEEATRLFV